MLGFCFYVYDFLKILEKIINIGFDKLLRNIFVIVLSIVKSINIGPKMPF